MLPGLPVLAAQPLPPPASPLRVALGAGLLLAIGLLAVAAARGRRGRRPAPVEVVEALALAVVAGPALAAPLLLAAGIAGLPLRGRPTGLLLAALAAGVAGVAALRWRWGRRASHAAPAGGAAGEAAHRAEVGRPHAGPAFGAAGEAAHRAEVGRPHAGPAFGAAGEAAQRAEVGPPAGHAGRSSRPAPFGPAPGGAGRPLAAARPADRPPSGAPPRALLSMGRLALAAALVLALVKLALVPLWSWDHFAIWGLKARLFAAAGHASPEVVAAIGLRSTVPDYPLGVPLAWVAATLGAVPGEAVVRAFHVVWLLALMALVHAAARRLAGGGLVPLAAAAFVAVSPLAWDSVHVGLADLPLALAAVAAVAAAAAALGGEAAGGAAAGPVVAPGAPAPPAGSPPGWGAGGWAFAGLAVGFLPWVKSEGGSLAALLLAALAAWRWRAGRPGRRADLAALGASAAVVGGAAVAVGRLLPRGVSFFDGHLAERLADRLADPAEVLAPVFAELAGWQWLGAWAALLVVLAAAAVRHRPPALLLAAVAALQLAAYVAVFFVTYIDVADHVATALHRVAAALVPLAALAAAALAGRGGHGTRSPRITP